MRIRALVKRVADVIATVLVWPAAAMCRSRRNESTHHGESFYSFWSQVFSLLPGPPGIVLRRAFYRQTLEACGASFYLAFGAQFTHRHAIIEDGVYVGGFALIGCARLGRGCLIGSRVSILSGGTMHEWREDGTWSPSDYSRLQMVNVGSNSWIGEGAIVMADVGEGAMVAAGAVVSSLVPPSVVVAGNPARFVRRLSTSPAAAAQSLRSV